MNNLSELEKWLDKESGGETPRDWGFICGAAVAFGLMGMADAIGTNRRKCQECHGRGFSYQSNDPFACAHCNGSGTKGPTPWECAEFGCTRYKIIDSLGGRFCSDHSPANGGQRCDVTEGPCACGAWHESKGIKG